MYQPWRNEAFLADEYVQAMTPVQRWMYRTILQASFTCSERPYLPDDDARLWVLAGCESPRQWEDNKDVIRARFSSETVEGKPRLGQKKVLEDWVRIQDGLANRNRAASIAGKASAAKRQRNDDGTFVGASQDGDLRDDGKTPTASNGTLAKPNQPLDSVQQEPTNVTERNSELQNTNVTLVGGVARLAGDPSPEKPKGAGKVKMFGWKAEFQLKVQGTAAGLDKGDGCGTGVVFSVPLPEKLFQWVEQTAANYGMDDTQQAVISWLEARSFNQLGNPNIIWDKMEDEILPFLPESRVEVQS
jgi:hypothetical protein